MEGKKLTDEEIVKALDICTTADDDMDCIDDCPMYEEDYCTTKLLKMAFDLIQRLQHEKAELQKQVDKQEKDINSLLDTHIYKKGFLDGQQQAVKDTAKEILAMFNDSNYITENELQKAIAERYGVSYEENN